MLELVTVEKKGQLVLVARPVRVVKEIVQMCPWYYISEEDIESGIGGRRLKEKKWIQFIQG